MIQNPSFKHVLINVVCEKFMKDPETSPTSRHQTSLHQNSWKWRPTEGKLLNCFHSQSEDSWCLDRKTLLSSVSSAYACGSCKTLLLSGCVFISSPPPAQRLFFKLHLFVTPAGANSNGRGNFGAIKHVTQRRRDEAVACGCVSCVSSCFCGV